MNYIGVPANQNSVIELDRTKPHSPKTFCHSNTNESPISELLIVQAYINELQKVYSEEVGKTITASERMNELNSLSKKINDTSKHCKVREIVSL